LPHDSFLILKSRDGARLLSDLLERENRLQTLICQNLTVRSASQGNYVLQDHLSRPGICTVEAEGSGAFLEAQISDFLDFPQDGQLPIPLKSRIDGRRVAYKQESR
jgi:hypothetical protein